MQLVIETAGSKLSVIKGRFVVSSPDKLRKEHLSPEHLSHITLTNRCSVTTQAMILAIDNQIPILLINNIGEPKGMIWSHYYGSIATIRRGQMLFSHTSDALDWMLGEFAAKTQGQIENLQNLDIKASAEAVAFMQQQAEKLKAYYGEKLTGAIRAEIMGIEGSIAARYFQTIS